MMEAICSSKTLVLTTATQRHIPEDGILFQLHLFGPLCTMKPIGDNDESDLLQAKYDFVQ
jgi:hypothetical protein